MQINIKISQKLILLNLMGMFSDTQNTRNNKFAKLWQHLKKEVWDEVDFSYADKHQTFSQVDKINYGGHS